MAIRHRAEHGPSLRQRRRRREGAGLWGRRAPIGIDQGVASLRQLAEGRARTDIASDRPTTAPNHRRKSVGIIRISMLKDTILPQHENNQALQV